MSLSVKELFLNKIQCVTLSFHIVPVYLNIKNNKFSLKKGFTHAFENFTNERLKLS